LFPLSVGVVLASFGALGCQVSDSEVPFRGLSGSAGSDAPASPGDSAVAGQPADDGSAAVGGNVGGTAATPPVTYMGGAGKPANLGGTGGAALPSASSGGSSSQGGSGGAGGAAAAGSGGAGGAGGAGGTGGAGGAGGTGNDSCPTDYVVATHIVINVSWDSTLVLASGSGQVHVWTKSHFVENGNTATLDSQSCGSVLPTITTSAAAGSEKILPEIPDTTWDAPNMPHFIGTATRSGDNVNIDPGVALVGLSMSNPTATWPSASSIMGVDHDGDGQLGITAVAKVDSGYSAPPANLFKTARADKLYLAIRNVMTLSSAVPGCPATYSGTALVSKFENHVIGCHIKGGGECTGTQSQFEDDNRTVYKLGSATFTSQRVDSAATCADVRAALPH